MDAIDYLINPPSAQALAQVEESIGQLEDMTSELHAAAESAHGFSLEERVANAATLLLRGDADDADANSDLCNDDARSLSVERSADGGSLPHFLPSSSSSSSDIDGEEAAFDNNHDNISDGASYDDNQDDGYDYDDYSSDYS
jgi:hypothetical protein